MEDFRGEHGERSTESLVKDSSSLDKKAYDKSTEIANAGTETGINSNKDDLKDTFVKTGEDNKDNPTSLERSQRSQPSPTENDKDLTISSLYRIGKTDTWGCKKCNLRGDKWFMQKHLCKGA